MWLSKYPQIHFINNSDSLSKGRFLIQRVLVSRFFVQLDGRKKSKFLEGGLDFFFSKKIIIFDHSSPYTLHIF